MIFYLENKMHYICYTSVSESVFVLFTGNALLVYNFCLYIMSG